jgi:hypothetical protein
MFCRISCLNAARRQDKRRENSAEPGEREILKRSDIGELENCLTCMSLWYGDIKIIDSEKFMEVLYVRE